MSENTSMLSWIAFIHICKLNYDKYKRKIVLPRSFFSYLAVLLSTSSGYSLSLRLSHRYILYAIIIIMILIHFRTSAFHYISKMRPSYFQYGQGLALKKAMSLLNFFVKLNTLKTFWINQWWEIRKLVRAISTGCSLWLLRLFVWQRAYVAALEILFALHFWVLFM